MSGIDDGRPLQPGADFTIGDRFTPVDDEPILWWLSFVDTTKSAPREQQVPGGGGFLGVCIVPAYGFVDAVETAWRLGCNPGGEVAGIPTDPETDLKWIGRLLTLADIEQLEAEEERAA